MFKPVKSGGWVIPARNGYLAECCDCGLIHLLKFKLKNLGKGKKKIAFQAFRVKSCLKTKDGYKVTYEK